MHPLKRLLIKILMFEDDCMWYVFEEFRSTPYPPSFYKTHTKEEIEEIIKRDREKLKKMIDELE